jgi:hypothetical protein
MLPAARQEVGCNSADDEKECLEPSFHFFVELRNSNIPMKNI